MIGGISGAGIGYYNPYTLGYQRPAYPDGQAVQKPAFAMVRNTRPAASPEIPVQPVRPAPAVTSGAANPQSLPIIREGADPVEMAVRMRIQYPDSQNAAQASAAAGPEGQLPPLRQGADLPRNVLPDEQAEAGQAENAQAAKSAQEVFEEGECQTCKERKYQDGSDDPGVSFKTPTSVDPSQAASAVRGHEMEHVTREQAKARREDRKVVSQSVTYHTAICPECGKTYVSGGTTRTVTKANNEPQQEDTARQDEEQAQRQPFSAIA